MGSSPIPDQIPPALNEKLINHTGSHGVHGGRFSDFQGTGTNLIGFQASISLLITVNRPAGYMQDGAHGRHAPPPTHGTSGGTIDVQLDFGEYDPSNVHVRHHGYGDFEFTKFDFVMFDVHGGNGGDGGWGEHGMHGGQGRHGENATMYRNGEDGGRGGDGGNGGFGSDGANGGDGGIVNITVDDDKLDLLLAVGWNIQGGVGGEPGQHGNGGNGGPGGTGGASFTW